MTCSAGQILQKLATMADAGMAEHSARFFKTGKGQYGEGDIFLGIRVPVLRGLVKQYRGMPLNEVLTLLGSGFHEARLLAVLMLVDLYKRGNLSLRQQVFRHYLEQAAHVNNWDIVDSSAPYILGPELMDRDHQVLFRLARSESLWERRMAVMATFHFVRHHQYETTLQLAELLLDDREDLVHKACGWMLRETGNRDLAVACGFLDRYVSRMPRTMLRHAIEKFPEKLRQHYLESR